MTMARDNPPDVTCQADARGEEIQSCVTPGAHGMYDTNTLRRNRIKYFSIDCKNDIIQPPRPLGSFDPRRRKPSRGE